MKKQYLKKLYKRFLKLEKKYFFIDIKKHSTSLKGIKLSHSLLNQFFENFYKPTFFSFLQRVKFIVFCDNVFDFIKKTSTEDWKLWPYLKFLKEERIIKIKKDGRVVVSNSGILDLLPRPQKEKEIKQKIEKALGKKINSKEPTINFFKNYFKYSIKSQWDQMPISQISSVFLVKKILDYLPLYEKFLFVGDDDFISVILGIVDPKIKCTVVDSDEDLLQKIKILKEEFNLLIETKKVDVRKKKVLKGEFVGFLTNPIYTTSGVEKFVKYGVSHLGKNGGVVFLEVGDESIGNRFLFLQEFFTKQNLIVREVVLEKIFYPYIELYKEDEEIKMRMKEMVDEKVLMKSPKLSASLWVFEYLPFKPKKINFTLPMYAYL